MFDSSIVNEVSAPPVGSAEHMTKPVKRLGERLIDAGLITQMQLELALREKKRQDKFLGEILVDLGFVTPDALTHILATENKTDVVDVVNTTIDPNVLATVDYDIAKQHKLIPLQLDGNRLTVAFSDAYNIVAIDLIERQTGKTVNVVTAPEKAILEALENNYAQSHSILETIDQLLNEDIELLGENIEDISPMVKLVDQIIARGVKDKASDIHIEPDERVVRVRYRVDGVLRSDVLVPGDFRLALTARLKLMAGINVSEKRVPQDGRIHFKYGSGEIDLRVSTLPTSYGESIVLRILDSGSVKLSLDKLGLSSRDNKRFIDAMNQPYGMVLVTGPTGSGKTTTLYTALGQVDKETRSVFTLEDPIEYSLPMIRQTPINAEVGMDFAAGLRALLRQDPDVILLGEIRDLETSQLAIRAALTGHLVLSTLHTNTAAGSIPRLIDMGVERYLLPSALHAVMSQRLVRRLCEHCKQEISDSDKLIETYGLADYLPQSWQFYQSSGCDHCGQSGFQGRKVIYEMLMMDETMHDLVINNASVTEIEQQAKHNGMKSIFENGVQCAAQGMTTIDEVLRVVR